MSGRLFAVGDIHGCPGELEALLDGIGLAGGDTLCFVGDYIDRGSDSRGVIESLLGFRPAGVHTVFLKGNHEDMCLGYLGRGGHWGESWLANGGGAALRSYGLDAKAPAPAVEAAMGPTHLGFLEQLERTFVWEGWRCVHAGVHPARSWADQIDEDLFWIREEFLSRPHALPETVVFGHTPNREVLVDLPYKIGIDTGLVYGGCLTALEVPERVVHQVRAGERRVRSGPLPERRRGR